MSPSAGLGQAPLEARAFLDGIHALAWSALPDGSLDFINGRFREYTGLTSEQLYGSQWKSAVHRDDIQPLETWWQNLRKSQEAGTTELRLRRFDGSKRGCSLRAASPLSFTQHRHRHRLSGPVRTSELEPPEVHTLIEITPIYMVSFSDDDVIHAIVDRAGTGEQRLKCIEFDTIRGQRIDNNEICVDAARGTLASEKIGHALIEFKDFSTDKRRRKKPL